MCGIAGFYSFDEREALTGDDLKNMVAQMAHRGPDDQRAAVMGRTGLGMCRLAIIDPEGSRQPLTNETSTISFIFNGEIYNYRELREELRSLGHTFATNGDGEVVVHGYEEWGEGVLGRLNGMFALALWDEPRQTLLLARDRIGIKPLYYANIGKMLLFASEVKALLASRAVSAAGNREALECYLAFRYVPAPHTFFEGITKLAPGEYLVLSKDGVASRSFYSLGFLPKHTLSEEDVVRELDRLIDRSIALRLRSDAPLGVFLSGGLDSGYILATARKHVSGELNSYTVGFDRGGRFNEIGASRVMSKRYGTVPNELEMTCRSYMEALPRAVFHMEEPMADPSSVPMMELSRIARQRVKVILSGEGGDELFSGYPRYLGESLAATRMPLTLLSRLAMALSPLLSRSRRRGLRGLSVADGATRHLLWETIIPPEERAELLGDKALESQSPHLDPLSIIRRAARGCDSRDERDRLSQVDIRLWLVEDLLLKKDKMGMSASIEARVPYLDHAVVDFACRLEPRMKVRRFTGKYIFRKLLEKSLPPEILSRPKVGFAVPLASWFREELRGGLGRILHDDSRFIREYLDRAAVGRLLARHQRGADLSLELFTLLVLELWGRIFILGESHRAISEEISATL